MDDIVSIKTFATRSQAEIAKSVLDANHIASYIQTDDAGGMYPFMTEQIQLLVKKIDVQEAKNILQL